MVGERFASLDPDDHEALTGVPVENWEAAVKWYKALKDGKTDDIVIGDTESLTISSTPKFFHGFIRYLAQESKLTRADAVKLGIRQGLRIFSNDPRFLRLKEYRDKIDYQILYESVEVNAGLLAATSRWAWVRGEPTKFNIRIPTRVNAVMGEFGDLLGIPSAPLCINLICLSWQRSFSIPGYTAQLGRETSHFWEVLEHRLVVLDGRFATV